MSTHNELPIGQITIKGVDDGRDTYIKIGCYRETGRLGRMLDVFQKALTLAVLDGKENMLRDQLLSLHDHKGMLTVDWVSHLGLRTCRHFVEKAWGDECECSGRHCVKGEEVMNFDL